MIDVEPNPSIQCKTIRKILGFAVETKRVYLGHENGSVTWCVYDVSSRTPLFKVGNTLPELEEAEIVMHVILEGVQWIPSEAEFGEKAGWSDIAEEVMFAYEKAMKDVV